MFINFIRDLSIYDYNKFINIINFIRNSSIDDYNKFINFINHSRDYPYFSSLYDLDDFNNDFIYFKKVFNLGGIYK